MSAVVELTEALIAGGMSPGAAAGLVARAGAELSTPILSKGAQRTRKWRANRPSPTVTERHAVTPERAGTEASPTVTERHQPSRGDVSLSLSKEERKIKRERRAEQLCDGWRPQPADWQTAIEQLGEPIAEIELQKFTDHARTNGRTAKDWNAAWRNWVRRAVEYRGSQNGHRTSGNRANPTAGHAAAGQDAILAGMGRIAARVRERGDAERRERELSDGPGSTGGDDARHN